MRERRGLVSWTTEIALGGLGSSWSDLGVPSVIRILKPMRARLLNDHCCLHWSKILPPPWLSILKKAEMIFPTFDDCFQCGIMGSSSWLDPLHFTCQAFLQTWEVVFFLFFFFFPPFRWKCLFCFCFEMEKHALVGKGWSALWCVSGCWCRIR